MEYTLMHKNVPVVDMTLDETGFISKLSRIHDERHLPVGIHIYNTGIDRKALNDWWLGRSIPASRDKLQDALAAMQLTSATLLIEKCCGLSLSDHYWICPKDSGLTWEKVNFFTNDFSTDIGEILFGRKPNDPDNIVMMSPDNTSDGWLRKKWIIVDGKRYLMKGGSGYFQQEPFNEVIASEIMTRLGVYHIDYSLTFDDEQPYSLCEDFVTPETELIPALRVTDVLKKSNQDSAFTHLLRCCDSLEIPFAELALGKMLTVDYIIVNEDRHYNNFGFIRNADTLEWIGLAPIFDSGTSLWYNSRVGAKTECKPFRSTHEDQIKLVRDLKWFDFSALEGIDDKIKVILSSSDIIDELRCGAVATHIISRAKQIEQLAR